MDNVLDIEMMEEAMDALGERYTQAVKRFLEEGEKRIARMHEAITSNGQWDVVAFESHAFISSSGCLGAAALPTLATNLEVAARALQKGGEISSLLPLLTEFSLAFAVLKEAMNQKILCAAE